MMNRIGKILVIGQTALSLMFMAWAFMVYFQYTDYGWKEPRKIWETKDSGYRIASQIDKRTATLHELYRQRDRALPSVKPALIHLKASMEAFPKNHQFYIAELEKIRVSDEPISPKQLTWKDGRLVLEQPVLGKPAMKAPVAGIEKSTKTTTIERDKILEDIKAITPEITKLIEDARAITIQLDGDKDTQDIGLYEILENETTFQSKIREEKEYIMPLRADALRRVETFRDLMNGMKRTLTSVPK
jgi:hypothetical protein